MAHGKMPPAGGAEQFVGIELDDAARKNFEADLYPVEELLVACHGINARLNRQTFQAAQ